MKKTTLQVYKQRMIEVLVHIQQNLDQDLPLEELAGLAHFSPYHFHRVFRGMIGESVKSHIRRLRLERAATRLKSSLAPVTQLAFDAGYETHEAFTRAFKAMFGLAPSQYRTSMNINRAHRSGSDDRVHFQEGSRIEDFELFHHGVTNMDVAIKKIGAMNVAFIRHVGPYMQCGQAWGKLCAGLGPKGMLGPNSAFIGLCHDDPDVTPADKIRYDACVTVPKSFKPDGDLAVQSISGGDYAVMTHRGPYEKLNESYALLMGQWLPQSGRELRSAPCFEIYRNSPEQTAPEDLVTDIHVPLES